MLGELFQKVLDMSLIGCYSILIVMAVRLSLSRFERKFTYYLWFVVFLNLCIPLSFQGVFSLIPSTVAEFSVSDAIEEVLGSHIQGDLDAVTIPAMLDIEAGIDNNYNFALGNPGGADYPSQSLTEETTPLTIKIASGVWLAGIAAILIWSLVGMLRLKNKVSRDKWIHFSRKQGIAEVAEIDTPFLWGILKPIIYLPTDLELEEMRYIVAHEQYHKRRKDYLIKIAVFLVAAVHWFNPLVWVAYTLFCKDMEISCDEAVLLEFRGNIRKQYARSLLKYAARQSGFVLSPITFGEPAVKTRIKNVLRFRRRGFVITVLSVICVVGVAAGLVLRPFAEESIPQEISGQNTPESELHNLSVDKTNDTSNVAPAIAETQEGWLPVMRAMADTFTVDAGYGVGAHTEKAAMSEEELAGINDGEILAYITDLDTDIISIDVVEWVTVPSSRADELGITEEDGPSGFYVYNPDTLIEQFTLSADCTITILDWQNSFETQSISADDFIAALQERGEQNLGIPYSLEIANGKVTKISEHYVP